MERIREWLRKHLFTDEAATATMVVACPTFAHSRAWREKPTLAKFADEIAPIEAAHLPAILRQFPR
jgi:hypothetical protein